MADRNETTFVELDVVGSVGEAVASASRYYDIYVIGAVPTATNVTPTISSKFPSGVVDDDTIISFSIDDSDDDVDTTTLDVDLTSIDFLLGDAVIDLYGYTDGTIIPDNSGNGLDATLAGDVDVATVGGTTTYSADGTGDPRCVTAIDASLSPDSWTVVIDVSITGSGEATYGCVLGIGTGTTNHAALACWGSVTTLAWIDRYSDGQAVWTFPYPNDTDTHRIRISHNRTDPTISPRIWVDSSEVIVTVYTAKTGTLSVMANPQLVVLNTQNIAGWVNDANCGVEKFAIYPIEYTTPVIVNGVFQTGYTGTITTNGAGYDVEIATHPVLGPGQWDVDVYVEDDEGAGVSDSWSFDVDTTPTISNQTPSAGVSASTVNVSFSIDDVDDDVETTTLDVDFTSPGAVVAHPIINGVFQAGYAGTITTNGAGYDVVISTHPVFDSGTWEVDVYVEDSFAKSVTDNWTFDVNAVPIIEFPLPSGSCALVDDPVSFTITDADDNVDTTTLDVNFVDSLATANVIIAGVFQLGFTGSITANGSGYDVIIATHPDFEYGNLEVAIYVEDTIGGVYDDSYSFNVNTAPTISSEHPVVIGGDGSVSVSFTLDDVDDNIDTSTLDVDFVYSLATHHAIVNGVFQAGYVGMITPNGAGCDVAVTSHPGLPSGTIHVDVYVEDDCGAALTTFWEFDLLVPALLSVVPGYLSLRVNFTEPMMNDSEFLNPDNYTISPALPGTTADFECVSVTPESVTNPTYVILTMTDCTHGSNYTFVIVPDKIRSATGVAIVGGSNSASFVGVSVAPGILLVQPTSLTTMRVTFSKDMSLNDDIKNPATYIFNNGLKCLEVTPETLSSLILRTTTQIPGTIYTLTIG